MQEPLYQKINQQFSDAVQLLLKVQQLQSEDTLIQEPINQHASDTQKMVKSIIYKDSRQVNGKQRIQSEFSELNTQQFAQQSKNNEDIEKLQKEAMRLSMLNSFNCDTSRLTNNRLKLNNRIRTEKLQLLLRISQSLDTFIKEQNLTQFQNQTFRKEFDTNSIQQIKSLQVQINQQLQQLNAFSQDEIIDKEVMQSIESLKAELNERYGQNITQLDEKNQAIIQQLREQHELNKKIQNIFNFKDFYSCNYLSDFYRLHEIIEDKIINRQILNSQVVNGNNIQRIVQHNLNISMEFSVLLNLIMYNFTLVIVKQILNKLERREQIQNVQQISDDLVNKLISFETPEEILIYLDKLASIREDERRLGSNFVYHAIKIQDYNILEELVQCSYTQEQLKQTIMQQINNFASVDQFTEQIYHLMKNNEKVNECDLDLLQTVLLEDNEIYYNQLVDDNNDYFQQRHITMDKQLANTLAKQSQTVANGQISKSLYKSSKMFITQPQKQTELSQMLQYIQIYNYRQSEQFVDKSHINLKKIQEQVAQLEQKQQQHYQTIYELQTWYENNQQISIFLKQIKTIMSDMTKFYQFIQYQIFIDHIDNSYDKIINYTKENEEEQNMKLKEIINYIEVSQDSWHCKLSTQIKLKQDINNLVNQMKNDLKQKLNNVINLTGKLNQIEKYQLENAGMQRLTPQNNITNATQQQVSTIPIDLDLGVDELYNYTQNMQKQVHSQLVSEIELFNKLQQQFQDEEEQKHKQQEIELKKNCQESVKDIITKQRKLSSQDNAMIKVITEEIGI